MNSSSSTTSKRLRLSNGSDRLSELPDSILLHILSFLPILDAVRTVAIRRFGSLWTQLPSLEFDDFHFVTDRLYGQTNDEELTLRFGNFVRNVLFLHKGVPIQTFDLHFGRDMYLDDPINKFFDQELSAWIRFAIHRQVKNLYLHIGYYGDCHDLTWPGSVPHCVFTSQFLVELKLDGFRIDELSRVQMRSLTKLSLEDVEVSNEVFNRIILGCPRLQEMDLLNVTGLDKLRFTAPNIDKLTLDDYNGLLDCPNLKILDLTRINAPVQLVDVSSVREVNIGRCGKTVFEECLKKFSNAEVFKCFGWQLPYSEQNYLQTRWKCLHIESKLHGDELLAICRVLRSSPLVEELIVHTYSKHKGRTCDKSMLSLELLSCSLQQLKTVTMSGYEIPCHGLLRLAEFLLRSSVALEKLVILPSKDQSTMVNELKFVKQLLSFPRASTNARVIFGSETCEKVESIGE